MTSEDKKTETISPTNEIAKKSHTRTKSLPVLAKIPANDLAQNPFGGSHHRRRGHPRKGGFHKRTNTATSPSWSNTWSFQGFKSGSLSLVSDPLTLNDVVVDEVEPPGPVKVRRNSYEFKEEFEIDTSRGRSLSTGNQPKSSGSPPMKRVVSPASPILSYQRQNQLSHPQSPTSPLEAVGRNIKSPPRRNIRQVKTMPPGAHSRHKSLQKHHSKNIMSRDKRGSLPGRKPKKYARAKSTPKSSTMPRTKSLGSSPRKSNSTSPGPSPVLSPVREPGKQ